MENCLITQFKKSTGNTTLPIFETLVVNVSEGAQSEFLLFMSDQAFDAEIKGGILIDGDGNESTSFHGTYLSRKVTADAGGAKIYIKPKYYFTRIDLPVGYKINISELSNNQVDMSRLSLKLGCTGEITKLDYRINNINITDSSGINFVDITGTITNILKKSNNINSLHLSGSKITLNLEDLSYRNAQENESHVKISFGDITLPNNTYGNIKYVGTFTYFSPGIVSQPNVNGSVEELVEYANLKGITQGTINLQYAKALGNVTYEGISLAQHSDFINGNNHVSWDGNTITITH